MAANRQRAKAVGEVHVDIVTDVTSDQRSPER